MSSSPRLPARARFETVEFLRSHPDVLAEVEAVLDARQGEVGGVEGASPPLHLSLSDNWQIPPAEIPAQPTLPLPPPIPATAEDYVEFVRSSIDENPDQELPHGWTHRLPKPDLDADGNVLQLGDGAGPNQAQAHALAFLGHVGKGNRLAWCLRTGQSQECSKGHTYLKVFRCGLRYCRTCGRYNFQALYARYFGLDPLPQAEHGWVAKPKPGWVMAILDFTVRSTGTVPEPEKIRMMNRSIRRVLRGLLRKRKCRKGWGYLWCCEFGFGKSNLHAHGLYYGPYLPQEGISKAWRQETGDSKVVWIEKTSFRNGLAHALKYTSKPPSENPKHLAQLEAAFHGVRRVHTLGIFYNAPGVERRRPTGAASCPKCGEPLRITSGYVPIAELQARGLRDVDEERARIRRHCKILYGEVELWPGAPRGPDRSSAWAVA